MSTQQIAELAQETSYTIKPIGFISRFQRLTNQRSGNADHARAWKYIGNSDKNVVKDMRQELKERKMWHITLCNVISIASCCDQ